MTITLDAVYDGKILRFNQPIELEPNTRVRVTIEANQRTVTKKRSFLRTARSLNLQGPSDWSVRFEEYLYGQEQKGND